MIGRKPASVTKYVIRGKTVKGGALSVVFTKTVAWACGFIGAIGGHGSSRVTSLNRAVPPIQPPGLFLGQFAQFGGHLRKNRNRDLGRRSRPDIEPNRPPDTPKICIAEAFGLKPLQPLGVRRS